MAVFDLSEDWRFNPPLVEDDPLTGDCKVWSGGGSDGLSAWRVTRTSTDRAGRKAHYVDGERRVIILS